MPGCASAPRLAAFGGVAAPVPPASLPSSSAHRSTSASPVRASPVTGFRSPQSPGVRTTADTPGGASGNVLRTYAVSAFGTHRRSIDAAAPPALTSPTLRVALPCRAAARSLSFGRTSRAPSVAVAPFALRSPTRRRGPFSVLQRGAWLLHPGVRTARYARSVRHSPKGCAVLDCHRHVLPSERTPLHGPRRRGPASRLPCATRRRGPSPLLRTGPSSFASPVRPSPVTGFRSPPCSVSSPLRTPLPAPPATCFARVPSAPSALSASQSPLPLT